MPPSGYTGKQASSIVAFLRSCAESLENEGRSEGLSPVAALNREVGNISAELRSQEDANVPAHVLRLTASFYQRLINAKPANYNEFFEAVEVKLAGIRQEVLAIHVDA